MSVRALVDRVAPSIVTVSFTIRMKMNFGAEMGGGEPQETHNEINGVLLDSGIVVVSATQLNGPAGLFSGIMSGQGMQMEIVPSEFLVVFPDGTELSAELRAKDSDLDLAFIQITGDIPKDFRMSPLDLSSASAAVRTTPAQVPAAQATQPDIGDEIFLVNRCSRELNYEPILLTTRVGGVIRTPRTLLVIMSASDAFGAFTSSPVFNSRGELVGIATSRPAPENSSALATGRGGQPSMSVMMNAMRLYVLPVANLISALEKSKG